MSDMNITVNVDEYLAVNKYEVDEGNPHIELVEDPENGGVYLPKLLADVKLASSNGEGRRLIDGGGVKVDGEAVPAKTYHVPADKLRGAVLQVGKRKFARLA